MGGNRLDEEAIFQAAIQIESPSERAAYLARACGDDAEVRAAVDALLQAHKEAGDFLETPAIEKHVISEGGPVAEGPGTVVGRYELLERIGEGGFAVVYMAEQTEPVRRKVALKIVKPGMDTKQVIGRFEAERQALAMMDHPNIAKVLDGGATDSGRPYFVMELVRGISVTEYCDRNKLTTRKRLELFIDVCGALQHAHQKGVIHRDVKPTNVLVTLHEGRPVPKVIDFGVAKALGRPLTDKTLFTEFRQFVGTPEYMSPEQAQLGGRDVDTRCDIYALGVLLYELLTGTRPFEAKQLRGAGYDEILRTIRETAPPKPSTRLNTLGEALTEVAAHRQVDADDLGRLLRGDLDWIVMRCLEKDRTRRYETANGLALDIARHLRDEPVQAGPPGAGYRVRKFVRRHRTGVAAGLLVAAALVVGLVAATVGFVQVSHEREIARREATRATGAERDAVRQREHAEAQRRAADAQRNAAEAQRLRAQGLLARSQLDRGVRLLNEGSSVGLLDLLDARMNADEIPELRDAAGRLWSIAHALWADRLAQVLGPSAMAAFSPDGKLAATSDGTWVRVWDMTADRPYAPRSARLPTWPYTVLFSPDGKLVAAHSPRGSARLLDAATASPVGPVLSHDCGSARPVAFKLRQLSAAFSPDSRLLATAWIDGTVELWRTDTCKLHVRLPGHQGEVRTVAFSPDGKLLASGSWDRTARLWDVATGRPHGPPLPHDAGVRKVAFSPDGQLLATITTGRFARLWNVHTGQLHKLLAHRDMSYDSWDVAFSPDGKLVAACSGWGAFLWETATGQRCGKPMHHRGQAYSLRFSPDGRLLVTGSLDAAWFWDAATTAPLGRQWVWYDGFLNVVLSPKGKLLATADGQTRRPIPVRIWRTDSQLRPCVFSHRGGVHQLAFSRDGKYVATGAWSSVRLWELAAGQPHGQPLAHSDVTFVAFSRDMEALISRSKDGAVKMWNPRTGQLLERQLPLPAPVSALALSPDGKVLATASHAEKAVRLWNAATGEAVRAPLRLPKAARSMAFTPAGRLLVDMGTAAEISKAEIWDIATGRPCQDLGWIGLGSMGRNAFSPDGRRLALGRHGIGVEFRDLASGKPLDESLARGQQVWGVAYSPDGSWLATTSAVPGEADTVRLWDVATGPPYLGLAMPPEAAGGRSVAFSPDGKWLASWSWKWNAVRLWRLPTVPRDVREMKIRTSVALGIRRDAEGKDAPIPWEQWQDLREWVRVLDAAGSPEQRRKALDAHSCTRQGDARARRREWTKAAQEYSKAIKLTPAYWRLWVKRGDAYQKLKQDKKAIADYTEAIELRPSRWQLWDKRGEAHFRLKKHKEVIVDYTKAIELSPDHSVCWRNRAAGQAELGRWDAASADFSKALELNRDGAWYWYAHALTRLGADDVEGYRRSCAAMSERFGETKDPAAADWTAWTCALAPDAVADFGAPLKLAVQAASRSPGAVATSTRWQWPCIAPVGCTRRSGG